MVRITEMKVDEWMKVTRIVVAGDKGTGKSSLIATAATNNFPPNAVPLMLPTKLIGDYPYHVPMTVIDTSPSLEGRDKLTEELKLADVVVLTYACDQPTTFDSLTTFWLPELRRLEVNVPVILVGCKLELRADQDQHQDSMKEVMDPLMQEFKEVETCLECSALRQIQVTDVFYYAQKAVIYPTAPLLDLEEQTLTPRCKRALKRLFILCDHDKDGALNDEELDDLQIRCFNASMHPSEVLGLKRAVASVSPEGINVRGINLTGFLHLHLLFIDKGRLETPWTMLRAFGYNNDVRLNSELPSAVTKRRPDQSVELTNYALEFLKGLFLSFDSNQDGALTPAELEDLFSIAAESPWDEAPYQNTTETNGLNELPLDGFFSQWVLMTLLDPAASVLNLRYIGYSGDPSSAIQVTRRRSMDRRKKQTERNVFQCFVFGPKKAGKSALLNSFLRRPFSEEYSPSIDERYAVNSVHLTDIAKKTLVLREIPEDGVEQVLSAKDSLAVCDIALFVHDSSDESSWKRATKMLLQISTHAKSSGYEVPCLIVAAKDDLIPYETEIQDTARVSQVMGIEAPIPVSAKLGELNYVFRRIVLAAEQPHLSIPETEFGNSRKLVSRSLMTLSVVAAVAIVGLAAYRVYAARKSAS